MGTSSVTAPKSQKSNRIKWRDGKRVIRDKSNTQDGVASKEVIVIPNEESQEKSKLKESTDVRNVTNDE